MATKGSAFRAEGNRALRTLCAHCGTSIPTEVGHAHPLDEALRRETWGLVGHTDGPPSVFPACTACYVAGWRPPGFARLSGCTNVAPRPFDQCRRSEVSAQEGVG